MPLKILLDSNFLFVPLQFHIDIFREMERVTNRTVEIVLLSPVYEEVKALSRKKGITGKQAKMALRSVEKLKIVDCDVKPNETIDDLVLRIATKWRCPVATNDRALRKRLKDINISVIYVRGKSHLDIDGNILGV